MKSQWKTTSDLRKAAEEVFNDLRGGAIDADVARALGAQVRTAAKLAALELDLAKMTNKRIDSRLPSMKLS